MSVDFKFELGVMWSNDGTVKDLTTGKEVQPHRTPKPEAGGSEDEEQEEEEEEEEDEDNWDVIELSTWLLHDVYTASFLLIGYVGLK